MSAVCIVSYRESHCGADKEELVVIHEVSDYNNPYILVMWVITGLFGQHSCMCCE